MFRDARETGNGQETRCVAYSRARLGLVKLGFEDPSLRNLGELADPLTPVHRLINF